MAITQNGEAKVRITDVAEVLGVAPSTVSRALNGKKGVGARQREKILALAKEMGYEAETDESQSEKPVKRPLRETTSNKIAFVLGDIRNPFYVDLAYNIQKRLSDEGYQIVIFNTEYSLEREQEILLQADSENLAGVFLVTVQSESIVEALHSVSLPVVLVNRNLPMFSGDSVFADNFQAGYLAAVHLSDLYHKKIGFIRGPEVSSASSMRDDGFVQAMSNFGLLVDERFIFESDLKLESGREAAKALLLHAAEERPTAMIVGNDLTALGFMDECKNQGLSIPEDLSVISFDNIVYSSLKGIELTTVSQHVEEMSSEAARLMLKQLKGDTEHPERIIITPELVVRRSTMQAVK